MSNNRVSGRSPFKSLSLPAIAVLTLVAVFVSTEARAAVNTLFISGEASGGTFSVIPDGTPFTGTYSYDDAVSDTNGSGSIGTYATGEFFIDFGPALGTITFDQSAVTEVYNDQAIGFGLVSDRFQITAGQGARNTPGFSNTITGGPNLHFRQTGVGTATALASDALTGIPNVFGSPWDVDDQTITITVSAAQGGCPPFTSSCPVVLDVLAVEMPYLLTVTPTGSGTGVVVSEPMGIDCGSSCMATLGGTVVLTATPDEGSTFEGWSGCDTSVGDQCTVDLTSDRTITATFEEIPTVPALTPFGMAIVTMLLAMAGVAVVRRMG